MTQNSALLVVAHPSPHSLSHAFAAAATQTLRDAGWQVHGHDLYEERFDPLQRNGELSHASGADALVDQHCAQLARADLILVFHPNWWGQPPAMLKGWIDRVFRLGTAYAYPDGTSPDGVPVGLLRARCAVVVHTSNTAADREQAVFGDPLEAIWKRCVFGLCGVSDVVRRTFGPVSASTAEQRAAWLEEVRALVAALARPASRPPT